MSLLGGIVGEGICQCVGQLCWNRRAAPCKSGCDGARQAVADKKAWANIPPKANRKDPICFSKHLYKARNLIERFFNKIKYFRRIATRYDKLAENYAAALKLVAVRIWVRDL